MDAITEESHFDYHQAGEKLSKPTLLPVLEGDHLPTSSAKVGMCGAGTPLHSFMVCTETSFPHKDTETQAVIICEVRKTHKMFLISMFCIMWH
jgi:hypothetical protein